MATLCLLAISWLKNSPANAIKISAVILNLASDKPDSVKNRKRNISLLSDCCLWRLRDHKTNRDTSRETSWKKYLTTKKWRAQTWLCVWPRSIYQYSDMAPRLSGQKWIFLKFLLSPNSQKRLEYKENTIKYRSLSWKAQIHVRILIYRTWPISICFEWLLIGT